MNQANSEIVEPQTRRLLTSGHPTIQPCSFLLVIRWVLPGGLLLAALGASFTPWIDRPPAALILTAPDLAEFVKFLPEVRDGSLTVQRLLFLLPLFMALFSLPFVAVSPALAFPRWARLLVLAIAIPLALTLLPPVWSPAVLLSAEFRLQTLSCLVCLSLVALSRWLKPPPIRVLIALLIPLSAGAPALALWQFFVAQEAIASAYASPITPGWGAWLTAAGFTSVTLGALLTSWAIHPQPTSRP